jgi:hypothetical protein
VPFDIVFMVLVDLAVARDVDFDSKSNRDSNRDIDIDIGDMSDMSGMSGIVDIAPCLLVGP